jgi:hypothetical protein
MSKVKWTTREQAFNDYCWVEPPPAEHLGLVRQAFLAGMQAGTHFERVEIANLIEAELTAAFTYNTIPGRMMHKLDGDFVRTLASQVREGK